MTRPGRGAREKKHQRREPHGEPVKLLSLHGIPSFDRKDSISAGSIQAEKGDSCKDLHLAGRMLF